jgi:hypothetical protein
MDGSGYYLKQTIKQQPVEKIYFILTELAL